MTRKLSDAVCVSAAAIPYSRTTTPSAKPSFFMVGAHSKQAASACHLSRSELRRNWHLPQRTAPFRRNSQVFHPRIGLYVPDNNRFIINDLSYIKRLPRLTIRQMAFYTSTHRD